MTLIPVKTIEEALSAALIRNDCCEFMTHNNKPIDVAEQIGFFGKLTRRELGDFFIFLARVNDMPIGYAIVRIEGSKGILTGGIAKGYRGMGHGKSLFSLLIDMCRRSYWGNPWLEVLRTNLRAIRLYKSLGFKTVRTTKRLLEMEL